MVQARCIQKFRDKNNNIKGYLLEDCTGQQLQVSPDQLKMAIFSKQIEIINLTLTKDGRLIDKEKSTAAPKSKSKDAFDELWDYVRSLKLKSSNTDKLSYEEEKIAKKIDTMMNQIYNTQFKQIQICSGHVYTSGALSYSVFKVGESICVSIGDNHGYIVYSGDIDETEDIEACKEYSRERVEKTKWLVNIKGVSYYDVVMTTLDIFSKFTDTKYATVGRYIIPSDVSLEQEAFITQGLRYKMQKVLQINCHIPTRTRKVNIDAALMSISIENTVDGKYSIHAFWPSKIVVKRTVEPDWTYVYNITDYERESNSAIIIEASNKNFKQEISLRLQNIFKQSYANLKNKITEGHYLESKMGEHIVEDNIGTR